MARVRVAALKIDDRYINLLTITKEGIDDTKNESFIGVGRFEINEKQDILIFEAFLNEKELKELIQNLLENTKLEILDYCIEYNVTDNKRISFLEQSSNSMLDSNNHILSPFPNNSMLEEYWNLDADYKNYWLEIEEEKRQKLIENFDININYLVDRIGNFLYFKEIKEIEVVVTHQNDTFITLGFAMQGEFISGKYQANIEVKSFDDIILKETFAITERFKDFELQDEDYNIFLEIYNVDTGKCVYKDNFIFMKELCLDMQVAGKTIEIKDKKGNTVHTIQTFSSNNSSTSKKQPKTSVIDFQKYRNTWIRTLNQSSSNTFKGFKEAQEKEAFEHFINLVSRLSKNSKSGILYVADPYLFHEEKEKFNLDKFITYIKFFTACTNKEVRILTCHKELPKPLKNFINQNGKQLFRNIRIKSIIEKRKDDNGIYVKNDNGKDKEFAPFHDRWIASAEEEYGLTNSLNNFQKGVSFFKSHNHYFEDSERLWNTNDPDYIVKEFVLYEK